MYKSLQAGRAIAAIMVVLFHLGATIALEKYFGYSEFSIPFSFGASGVEFFFVLSGFIIYAAHQNDLFQSCKLRTYIRKRLVRIYPTYWFVFLPVFFVALAVPSLSNTVPHDVILTIQSLLLVPMDKSVVGGTGAPVIIVAWSLQYEIFFYFLFGLMIFSRLLSIIAVISVSLIYVSNLFFHYDVFPLTFLSQDYIVLFALGVFVSVVHNKTKSSARHASIFLLIGLALFVCIAADTVAQLNIFENWRILLYGLASSLIILGLVKAEDNGRIIGGQNWLQLFGNSSYALYLIHFPLISLLCKLCIYVQLDSLGIAGAVIASVVIFCSCLISSIGFHLWIEKPVSNYFSPRRKPA